MGPLHGLTLLEIGGIGPGPFAGMMLSDMGAEVIRIDKMKQFKRIQPNHDVLTRNRKSIMINLKAKSGIETVLRMIEAADGLQEGFRPGVMEQLGLGPETCLERNPRLVYGRMTGWGQEGPLAQAAGHDINYIALSGALHAIGQPNEKPVVPLNLIGDFGGGGMLLAFGMVCALFEAQKSGQGQVVDANILDGVAALMAMYYSLRASGLWSGRRGENLLDGGAPFYGVYETKDGKYISIGSIEPDFYALLRERAGLTGAEFDSQMDPTKWPEQKEKLTQLFKTKTRDQWCTLMEGTDVCFAPVLTLDEAVDHPHHRYRKTFYDGDALLQHFPVPRFSRTVPEIKSPPPVPGQHTEEILQTFGFCPDEIQHLRSSGVVADSPGRGV
ncbi:CoA transferase [Desulfosarcina sp. OttesenSCG-928-A07]|nr:CoA transferase [Desulfosarcina sp. OttesenSCG-928-G17]MDL2328967.1 CoA transferase [Desulfosarcina sp. OttesenSCG-928-A07]